MMSRSVGGSSELRRGAGMIGVSSLGAHQSYTSGRSSPPVADSDRGPPGSMGLVCTISFFPPYRESGSCTAIVPKC